MVNVNLSKDGVCDRVAVLHGTLPPGSVQLDTEDRRLSPRFNEGNISIMQLGHQVARPLSGPMAALISGSKSDMGSTHSETTGWALVGHG